MNALRQCLQAEGSSKVVGAFFHFPVWFPRPVLHPLGTLILLTQQSRDLHSEPPGVETYVLKTPSEKLARPFFHFRLRELAKRGIKALAGPVPRHISRRLPRFLSTSDSYR